MIMDSKHDPEQNAAPPPAAENETKTARRRKRIRHAWEEAPHSHDTAMRWVARLLMVVLIIVAYVAVHRMITAGK